MKVLGIIIFNAMLALITTCQAQIPNFMSAQFDEWPDKLSGTPKIEFKLKHDTVKYTAIDSMVYTVNFFPDSIKGAFSNSDIFMISLTNRFTTITVNNEKGVKGFYTYKYTPVHDGNFLFPSPVFYCKGQGYKLDSIPVYVKPQAVSEKYLKNSFIYYLSMTPKKPNNTMQILYCGEEGFYGIWLEGEFKVLKKLDKKQIKEINNILK